MRSPSKVRSGKRKFNAQASTYASYAYNPSRYDISTDCPKSMSTNLSSIRS